MLRNIVCGATGSRDGVEIALRWGGTRWELHSGLNPVTAADIIVAAAPAITGVLLANFELLLVTAKLVGSGTAVAPLVEGPRTAMAIANFVHRGGLTERKVDPHHRELVGYIAAQSNETAGWRQALTSALGQALHVAAFPVVTQDAADSGASMAWP